jgi:hypothetical protein
VGANVLNGTPDFDAAFASPSIEAVGNSLLLAGGAGVTTAEVSVTYDEAVTELGAFWGTSRPRIIMAYTTQESPGDTPNYDFITETEIRWRGYVVYVGSALTEGPVIESGTIVNPTTEGFQLRFTTDTDNGTAYYVLYPTTEDDPTDPEDIKNAEDIGGVAPIRDGSVAVTTTGEQTFPAITGLDPNTTYRAAVVHYGAPD